MNRGAVQTVVFASPLGFDSGGAGAVSAAYLEAFQLLFPGRVLTLTASAVPPDLRGEQCGREDIVVARRHLAVRVASLLAGTSIDRLSPTAERVLRSLPPSNTLVFINGSRAGRLAKTCDSLGIPTLTLFHNVEVDYQAAAQPNVLTRLLMTRAASRNDRHAVRYSDGMIFLSGTNRDRALELYPSRKSGACIETSGYFGRLSASHAQDLRDPGNDVLINCSLGLRQNLPGVLRFLSECWSRYSNHPALVESTLILAGGTPCSAILAAARSMPRVRVVSRPTTAEMDDLFRSARLCVSTIESGSGIKVRVADSLRMGRPVLATPHSCIGYDQVDPRVIVSRSIGEMGDALVAHFAQRDTRHLGALARSEFDRLLSFESGVRRLSATIDCTLSGMP